MFHGGQIFPEMRPFSQQYRVNSMAHCPGDTSFQKIQEMNSSGKILLPQSALDWLTRLHINYPMLFKVTNTDPARQRTTHCGVFEFHPVEGRCYMPHWMMQNLLLHEDDLVQVQYVNLPTATYVKFKPQSVDFLDISNARAVLELKLRGYACLTKGDVIAIEYNDKSYELLVQDLKPANAVSIIECDMNVEFDAPVGYKEPERQIPKSTEQEHAEPEVMDTEISKGFTPFSGEGVRLDGKTKKDSATAPKNEKEEKKGYPAKPVSTEPIRRGIPNYEYNPGSLTFIRTPKPNVKTVAGEDMDKFIPFGGQGAKIKERKK